MMGPPKPFLAGPIRTHGKKIRLKRFWDGWEKNGWLGVPFTPWGSLLKTGAKKKVESIHAAPPSLPKTHTSGGLVFGALVFGWKPRG